MGYPQSSNKHPPSYKRPSNDRPIELRISNKASSERSSMKMKNEDDFLSSCEINTFIQHHFPMIERSATSNIRTYLMNVPSKIEDSNKRSRSLLKEITESKYILRCTQVHM